MKKDMDSSKMKKPKEKKKAVIKWKVNCLC